MRHYYLISTCFVILTVFSSCSLLSLQLKSDSDPLSTTDMNIRVYTHTFTSTFFAGLEDAVDSLNLVTTDPGVRGNALLWLINNESAVQDAVFQVNPRVALADTWLLTVQMNQFLKNSGKATFGNYVPILHAPVINLGEQIEQAARRMLNGKEYQTMKDFVVAEAEKLPIRELNFTRAPIYASWLKYNQMPDTTAVNTVGTLPQVIAGFSNQFSVISGQLAKIASWQLEIASIRSGVTPESLKALGDSVNKRVNEFLILGGRFPGVADSITVKLGRDLIVMTNILDRRIALTIGALQEERAALDEMIARERANVMTDIDSISAHVTQIAIQEATGMIKQLLLYLSLFFAIILFVPFGLGFWSGRLFTRRKQTKEKPKIRDDK